MLLNSWALAPRRLRPGIVASGRGLVKKNDFPFVDEQGKEAVNFQITMILIFLALPLTCIGIVLMPFVPIVDFIFVVIAAIKANDGYHYRYPYPLIIRFVK